MKRPNIYVKLESRGEKTIYNLQIQGGTDPGFTVFSELSEISMKHSLPPEGGLYDVNALTLDGGTVRFLGGMYVQPSKYDAVLVDLQSMGYTIVTS